jgi:hypothetical protein
MGQMTERLSGEKNRRYNMNMGIVWTVIAANILQ